MQKDPRHASIGETKRASEYLANERTFLAWIRTSIAVVSLGFVLARFGVRLHSEALTKRGLNLISDIIT
jgi:putative membrane protein